MRLNGGSLLSKNVTKITYVLCILMLSLTCIGDNKLLQKAYSTKVGTLSKLVSLMIIPLAILCVLKYVDLKKLELGKRITLLLAFPMLVVMVLTWLDWVIRLTPMKYVSVRSEKMLFLALNTVLAIAIVWLLGEKSIDCVFWGVVLGNTGMAVYNAMQFGIKESVDSFVYSVTSGVDCYGFMASMEINDITFAIMAIVLYYILFDRKPIHIICGMIMIIIGFKRIAFLSMALMVVIYFFMKIVFVGERWKQRVVIFGVCCVGIAALYVHLCASGVFELITNYLGIETLGRTTLYRGVRKYYQGGFLLVGYGLNGASLMAIEGTGGAIEALHNNILQVYLDLGMVGFYILYLFHFVVQPICLMKLVGQDEDKQKKLVLVYFTCIVCMSIISLTDNNFLYFWDMLVMRVVPFGYLLKLRGSYSE